MSDIKSKTREAQGHGRPRDAERSKRAILDAALKEFSELGYSGARVDSISRRAGVSKPMIYSYFGDKDDVYAAALREAYVQIRAGERELNLDALEPKDAIRALVRFTMDHFRSKPWFISMLNTENLRGGSTIRKIADVGEIQSPLIAGLRNVLRRGADTGMFRADVEAADLYIAIASLCYFPISNAHTLREVFKAPVDNDEWLGKRASDAETMILRFLAPDDPAGGSPD